MPLEQRFEIAPLPPAIDVGGEDFTSGSTTWTALPDLGETTISAADPRRELDYMHARFHSPLTGRMLSVDPVLAVKRAMKRPQAWNRYAYVMGNPLKYVDPTGEVFQIAGCEAGSVDKCRAGKALLNRTLGDSAGNVSVGGNGVVSLNGISGADFAAKGTFQKGLGMLIGSSSTFSLNVGSGKGAAGGGGLFDPNPGGGGTIYVESGMFPRPTGDVQSTSAITFAHETGHAVGSLFPALYSELSNSLDRTWAKSLAGNGEPYATAFENRYRSENGIEIRGSYRGLAPDIYSYDGSLFPPE